MNRILLENYYLPGDLERQIGAFVEHYNQVRYHGNIDNVTPASSRNADASNLYHRNPSLAALAAGSLNSNP
jgi:transposase InsO family protein